MENGILIGLKDIRLFYGDEKEIEKFKEEINELIIAVDNMKNNKGVEEYDNLCEEVADVFNVLEHIISIFNLNKKYIELIRYSKVIREQKRIEKELNEIYKNNLE